MNILFKQISKTYSSIRTIANSNFHALSRMFGIEMDKNSRDLLHWASTGNTQAITALYDRQGHKSLAVVGQAVVEAARNGQTTTLQCLIELWESALSPSHLYIAIHAAEHSQHFFTAEVLAKHFLTTYLHDVDSDELYQKLEDDLFERYEYLLYPPTSNGNQQVNYQEDFVPSEHAHKHEAHVVQPQQAQNLAEENDENQSLLPARPARRQSRRQRKQPADFSHLSELVEPCKTFVPLSECDSTNRKIHFKITRELKDLIGTKGNLPLNKRSMR